MVAWQEDCEDPELKQKMMNLEKYTLDPCTASRSAVGVSCLGSVLSWGLSEPRTSWLACGGANMRACVDMQPSRPHFGTLASQSFQEILLKICCCHVQSSPTVPGAFSLEDFAVPAVTVEAPKELIQKAQEQTRS